MAPLVLRIAPEDAWRVTRRTVFALPRTRLVEETDAYLHVETRSAVFRFADDLEVLLRPLSGQIAVRSALRMGYGDLGANRRRVGRLRATLAELGVVESPAP